MVGNNTFLLNQANMIEAMQYWLDNVVFTDTAKRRVVSVKEDATGTYKDAGTFRVELAEKE